MRDIAQTKLLGTPHDDSSIGMIAPSLLVGRPSASHGTADLFDTIRVRHKSGGISTIVAKTYEQDRAKWQGQSVDWIWLDEEPPVDLYHEAIARLRGDGIIWVTFTPLAGFTEVVGRFLRDDSEDAQRDRGVVKMGLKDAEHFTPEEKRMRLASYPLHERAARENGDPTLGSGAVFTTLEATLAISDLAHVPFHWSKLWGVDYGVTHPFAAVLIAWDRDADVIYVLDTVRLANSKPIEHAAAMKRIAPDVRVAWPHDGNRRESDLDTITVNYRREGLLMLPTHATFPDGSISTEAGILEMQERMADGRFRVRAHLADWFDEYRSYHRDETGKLVKIRDDLLSATRTAVMAKRFARPAPIGAGSGVPRTRRPMPQIAQGIDFDVFALSNKYSDSLFG